MSDGVDDGVDTRPVPPSVLPRRWPFWVAALVVVAALAVGITLVRTADPSPSRLATIDARRTACDVHWSGRRSGQHNFEVTNHTRSNVGIELVDLPALNIRADLEMLAPGTPRPLTATVGRGTYKFRCEILNGATIESPVFRVTGRPLPIAHPFRPATSLALLGAVATLHDSTTAGVAQLATDTDALTAAIDGGALEPARGLWLAAHLDYARLGAAYGTFGDLDAAINGRPDGLPKGVDDPKWAGFLRLERALWTNQPVATVQPIAHALDASVHALAAAVGTQATDPTELTIRVHEILENAVQFELTGQTDEGSHTNLATARANVDGTRTALAAVTPLLQSNDPALLATATADLNRCAAQLDALRQPDGSWPPLSTLTRVQRELINGTFSQSVEDLSPIPDVLELTPEASDD
jgi:high-affinity iron transporter